MSDFNIFKVLSKDDKELIHSAFLKFMLETSSVVAARILGVKPTEIKSIELESGGDSKRLDIKVHHAGEDIVYVVENKFKSFPDQKQLQGYDKLIATRHPTSKSIKKLICFDKNTINFDLGEWIAISYKEIAEVVLESINLAEFSGDKLMFVQHYYNFLKEYIDRYETLKINCYSLFKDYHVNENENKFWLRLLSNQIVNLLRPKIIDASFTPFSTKIPLWSIVPKKWKRSGVELLVQFQGDDLKLYAHSADKDFVREVVDVVRGKLVPLTGKFNPIDKRASKTHFIYKEFLLKTIKEGDFTIEFIADYIYNFYLRMDIALS